MRKNTTERTRIVGTRWHDLASIGTAVIELASEIDATNSAASGCENQETASAANALHSGDLNCLKLSSLDAELRIAASLERPAGKREASYPRSCNVV